MQRDLKLSQTWIEDHCHLPSQPVEIGLIDCLVLKWVDDSFICCFEVFFDSEVMLKLF